MSDTENKLSKLLYRKFCPESSELGEYRIGILPAQRAAFFKSHLEECPHCSRELAQLSDYLEDVQRDLEWSLTERVKVWIAERVPDFSGPQGMAVAYSMRGESESLKFFLAGDAEITLDIAEKPEQRGRRVIVGLLTGVELGGGATARLFSDGELITEARVNELGNFVLEAVECNKCRLILSGSDYEIRIEDLTF